MFTFGVTASDAAFAGLAWFVLEEIVIYHFFFGAWLEAESAITVERRVDDVFDVFYNMTCQGEKAACKERRAQRILEHLMANRKGESRPPTDRACYTLPYEEFASKFAGPDNLGKGFLDQQRDEITTKCLATCSQRLGVWGGLASRLFRVFLGL